MCTNFVPFSLDMTASPSYDTSKHKNPALYDHRPYPLNDDDYMRVCKIPKRKVSQLDSVHYITGFLVLTLQLLHRVLILGTFRALLLGQTMWLAG